MRCVIAVNASEVLWLHGESRAAYGKSLNSQHKKFNWRPVAPMYVLRVYVLRSEKTGRRYTGYSEDFEERLRRHHGGESLATSHGCPWTLVHRETYQTRAEAVQRERYLKTGRGRDELGALVR